MTPYIKTGPVVRSALVLAGLCCASLFAGTQAELKLYDIAGDYYGDGKYTKAALNGTANIAGTYRVSPLFDLLVQENYDGVMQLGKDPDSTGFTPQSPFAEKFIPSSNMVGAGLRAVNFCDMQVFVQNNLYINARRIDPYYSGFMNIPAYDSTNPPNFEMYRKARNNINAYCKVPAGPFSFIADINYNALNYEQRGIVSSAFDGSDSTVSSRDLTSADLWSDFSAEYQLPMGMSAVAGTRLKQNLSGAAFMNLYQYEGRVQGVSDLPFGNKLTWSAGFEQYLRPSFSSAPDGFEQSIIDGERGFSKNLLYTLYLRDVYTIDRGLYFKVTDIVTMDGTILKLGPNFYKFRTELSLRKAWENESSLEGGYFRAGGGLFPQQGLFLRSALRMVPKFAIIPWFRATWEGPDELFYNDQFYRATGTIEASYAVMNNLELLVGGDYTWYALELNEGTNDFPNRGGIFFGLRSMLR
ncbi:MAG: hypothetical protein MUF22_08180 [Chitinispirillaceae bacterium]|nr:hypothetical protein [Chitinispirillaceae bacterium]